MPLIQSHYLIFNFSNLDAFLRPKTDEQKIAAAARARVYRARKAGKIPGFPAKNQDVD